MTRLLDRNTEALKKIANENTTSQAVFYALSQRERNRTNTDLRRLKYQIMSDGYKVVPEEFTRTFKELETLGLGKFIDGKGMKPSQFKWHVGMKEVADAVKTDIQPPQGLTREPVVAHNAAHATENVIIIFGNNRQIRIPADLTSSEAEFVSKFLLQKAK